TYNTALLIEVTGIQDYVFGSNRLKDNIGASYIIENALLNPEPEKGDIIREIGESVDFKAHVQFQYIGGGNAFLLVSSTEKAKAFCRVLSQKALEQFPGLRLAFGIKDKFRTGEGFKEDRAELAKTINRMKSGLYGALTPLKPGMAEDCSSSGLAAEVKDKSIDGAKDDYISSAIASKRTVNDDANKWLFRKYKVFLGEQYLFPTSFEEFGQEESGYIAVVHIDGNGLGKRFMSCKTLGEVKKQSEAIAKALGDTGQEFMSYICNVMMNDLKNGNLSFKTDKKTKKTYLPIRPLIMAGDDITFVCEGRLGLHLAEKYLELFEKNNIKACAGIAIVHTHFPFSSAYHQAEKIIARAKELARSSVPEGDKETVAPSCLEFAFITDSGLEGHNLSAFHGGPYHVKAGPNPWSAVKKQALELKELPAVKIHAIREAVKGQDADKDYLRHVLKSSKTAYELPKNDDKSQWRIIHNAIEILDFYPEILLTETKSTQTQHA
ncbi:MAG: Cas10/Cmr2 second palm domain-containing protein, partial [Bacteroidota bacterium]